MQVEQLDRPARPAAGAEAEFINRDLSDLAFVQRVLEQAENVRNPLLERARFLAITGLLLDEFYRIRVAALREQIRMRATLRSRDGTKPSKQLKRADKYSNRLLRRQDRCWRGLRRDLRESGIELVTAAEARAGEHEWLAHHFEQRIRPHLAPAIGTTAAALASLRDGDLLLFAELGTPAGSTGMLEAVVPIPADIPRFAALPGAGCRFISVEEVVKLFLDDLFATATVTASGLARVLREGSLKRFDDGDDLLRLVRDAIERRAHADVIRLRVERGMPERLTTALAGRLGLLQPEETKALEKSRRRATASEFVVADTFLGLPDLVQLIDQLPEHVAGPLRYPAFTPARPAFVAAFEGDLFRAIAARDRLLHFPYDDFDVLVDLIRRAAADESVVSIRQTLYRTGRDSPIVQALAAAAKGGKSVAVVVELEAREDEARNIAFAAFLEAAGVNVSYGHRELKVHAKLLVIERIEQDRTRCYVHVSTGNYDVSSGRRYTDVCLLSADPALADAVKRVFDSIHAGLVPHGAGRLAVAPLGLRDAVAGLIEREIDNARAGRPAAIWIKLNKLSDERMIRLLYRASEAGVDVRILVRGICCLRPGVPGLSDRIRVKSVVGRYLEHSRLLCFGNGHDLPSDSAAVLISSADLMKHKLDRRVEALAWIEDVDLKRQLQHDVLEPYWRDEASSWELDATGEWIRRSTDGFCAHDELRASGHAETR